MSEGIAVGPISIRYYGLIIAASISLCWWLALRLARKRSLPLGGLENVITLAIIFGFLGARAFVVVFNLEYFGEHPGEVFQIWKGGLAIYGAIIGALGATIFYSIKKKLDFWRIVDLLAIVTPMGQALGRWGNFFNQEAFGPPTSLPWKIYIEPKHRLFSYLTEKYYHPTFLYESLWDFAVFALLLYLSRRIKKSGIVFAIYLGSYSFGRFFIEYLRLDSEYIFSWRLNQLISLAVFVSAAVIFQRRSKINAQNP